MHLTYPALELSKRPQRVPAAFPLDCTGTAPGCHHQAAGENDMATSQSAKQKETEIQNSEYDFH